MPSFNFDAASFVAANTQERSPLARGMYQVIVMSSEIKTTQAGTGQYIELTLQVVDGEYSGRRVWDRLNVSNPNKTAEDIAKRQLQELMLAAGVKNMTDTEQLHDIPVLAEIDVDRKDSSRNRVTGYQSVKDAQSFSQAASRATTSPDASRPAGRPWEKRA